MAISLSTPVIPTALWPQGDIRDPLGIWGFRLGVTGDASGGGIKVVATEATDQKAAFIYTCYSAVIVVIAQAIVQDSFGKCRLLTNWPNIDPQAGVQGYGMIVATTINAGTMVTSPIGGPDPPFLRNQDRFLLLFDPRPSGALLDIVELELGINELADTYSFEGYGYYWDRSVLNAPGGPRHPGQG